MRYNETWKDWDGFIYNQEPPHGQRFELSWKRLTVSVEQNNQTFFGWSKTSYKQILHNGLNSWF